MRTEHLALGFCGGWVIEIADNSYQVTIIRNFSNPPPTEIQNQIVCGQKTF